MPTESTDWIAILPTLLADRASGLGVRAIAIKHNLPPGSVSRKLAKYDAESLNQHTTDSSLDTETRQRNGQDQETVNGSGSASLQYVKPEHNKIGKEDLSKADVETVAADGIELDRQLARKLLRRTLQGGFDPSAQQSGMIKLVLKDELEPEQEVNPYASVPTDELALRILTLAASVLGVARLGRVLRTEAQDGTLDLGLSYVPPDDAAPGLSAAPPASENARTPSSSTTLETSVTPATAQKIAADFGVESLET